MPVRLNIYSLSYDYNDVFHIASDTFVFNVNAAGFILFVK